MADIGDVVSVSDSPHFGKATVRYLGALDDMVGKWAGLELSEPVGKNDGKVKDKVYFTCKANHGVFVRANKLVVVEKCTETPPSPIILRLSPTNLSLVISMLPLPSALAISLVSKEIREKVDTNLSWSYLFRRDLSKDIKIPSGEEANWKNEYKKYYRQLLHPLQVKLSITPNEVKLGDKVQITYELINYAPGPLNVIVGFNHNYFKTGNLLRTYVNNFKGEKSIAHTSSVGGGLCGTFAKSHTTIVQDTQSIIVDAVVTTNVNMKTKEADTGLWMKNNILAHFLPLSFPENEVWVDFSSDGVYEDNSRTPTVMDVPFWKSIDYQTQKYLGQYNLAQNCYFQTEAVIEKMAL